ncbi:MULTISPECIES: 2-hydroxymuconate tautomerase [Pseudomonas]|nr:MULTISPECIES: 2-hydroxymuconate tautomerase [Pseudomonas]MDD1983501.1 2-hydroxymuconate tautomerase [Pseudomonas asiatica]MDD2109579.1 2-hydroxymuconate tautomerase [Pseudomonas asiatica]WQE54969.1 2-hydroxymuconate tautomerase [Pseudomonas putida]
MSTRSTAMPIAQLYIIEGRTDEQKETLIRQVSEAMANSLDAPLERVRVLITEMPKNHFGIGGEPASKVRR